MAIGECDIRQVMNDGVKDQRRLADVFIEVEGPALN